MKSTTKVVIEFLEAVAERRVSWELLDADCEGLCQSLADLVDILCTERGQKSGVHRWNLEQFLQECAEDWDGTSGSTYYPVPEPDDGREYVGNASVWRSTEPSEGVFDHYIWEAGMYEGEYGDNRLDYLGFIASKMREVFL